MRTANKRSTKSTQRSDLPAKSPKHRVRFPVEVADPNGVRNVVNGLLAGKTLSRACGDATVSQMAFWRRVLGIRGDDPADFKRELAAALMNIAIDRADQFSAGGNSAVLSTFAKVAKDSAAALAPRDWGDKVQIDQRSLVINTNLGIGEEGIRDLARIEADEILRRSKLVP